MSFEFIQHIPENENFPSKHLSLKTESETPLPAVLYRFREFLLACGYREETVDKYLNGEELMHQISNPVFS